MWITPNAERNRKIVALAGKLSYGLIAEEVGATRAVVAGVIWRHNWPYKKRISSPNGHHGNKCGTGRGGYSPHAKKTLHGQAAS